MDLQNRVIRMLYGSVVGRQVVKLLVRPSVSNLAGKILDSKISVLLIPGFVKRNHIDLSEFENKKYVSYNDFFTRRIKPGKRKIDMNQNAFISPCDSKLTVYPIHENQHFEIKGAEYDMEKLFRSKKIAKHYHGGMLFLFRLSVDDYHRYCYVDDGVKTKNYRIPGVFHTVNPYASEIYPIYKENTREFTLLKSKHFGTLAVMEVGAMLVGRIVNLSESANVKRGQEKGRFEFGGSTIIICVQKNQLTLREDILYNSKKGKETIVKMGEKVAMKQ